MMTALRRIPFTSLFIVILISFPALGKQNPVGDLVDCGTVPQNQYFPLVPGTTWSYLADNGEAERAKVLNALTDHCEYPKTVAGVQVCVVEDRVFDETGLLIENTCDWYAPDTMGNVLYLGEDAHQYPANTTEGSWEAGVEGPDGTIAEAGIIMEANPSNGDKYRQEFAPGVAEDVGQVISHRQSVSVEAGDFDNCLETMDSSTLEPGDREHKYYCPGVGLVREVTPKGGRGFNELQTYSVP
jgi:hypothetical protein